MRKILTFAFAVALLFAFVLPSFAHSGGTDSNGGHYDHSTGIYHYHYDSYSNYTSAYTAPSFSQETKPFVSQEDDPYKYLPKDSSAEPAFDFKEEYTSFSKTPISSLNEKGDKWDEIGVGFLFLIVFYLTVLLICFFCSAISKRKSKKREEMQRVLSKTASLFYENEKLKSAEQPLEDHQRKEQIQETRQPSEQIQRQRVKQGKGGTTDSKPKANKGNRETKVTEYQEQKYVYIIRSSKDYME